MFLEQSDTFVEGDLNYWILALEGLEFELFVDSLELSSESRLEIVEDVGEELSEKLKNFEIVFLDGHLDIQAYKLAHVTMGKRVLSSEDGTDLENSLEISHNAHLLVKLRRLGKTGLLAEILETEHIGSTF